MSTDVERIEFLGCEFSKIQQIDDVIEFLICSSQKKMTYIVTPNVDHIVKLTDQTFNTEFYSAYQNADLVINDSRVLSGLAWLSSIKLPAIPGSDITATIFAKLYPGTKILLLSNSEEAFHRLSEKYPKLKFTHLIPPPRLLDSDESIDSCVASAIKGSFDFVFLAFGTPQQEIVAHRIFKRSTEPMAILCVGASLDFIGGNTIRAPIWIRRFGFEWLYRLLREPKRLWRRYLLEGPKIFVIFIRWYFARYYGPHN